MNGLSASIGVLALVLASSAGAEDTLGVKEASDATIAANKQAAVTLPPDGTRDAEFAVRGFIATSTDPLIRDVKGNVVWDLSAYDFVEGPAPATVHPSLWRHMRHLKHHGLFQVTENQWQVRGFDLSNMTVLKGDTGWILIDPLTTQETAKAALDLVNQELGERPVSAVIYSHSHADHFGGVRGVVDQQALAGGKVEIIAPEGFVEEASSENVIAGGAMQRRATFQFGAPLKAGETGAMGSGIGTAVSRGTITLLAPTDIVSTTGEKRVVDGVEIEFQIASGSEAPAEFTMYIAPEKTFLAAEVATCTMHNVLTPRGAKVRDTAAWARYLDEAVQMFASRSQVVTSSHCWPIFGEEEGKAWLTAHRDNYRYLHDQTVRRMNQGETIVEVAEEIPLPARLGKEWANHGYYGTYNHNSKAIYQHYLGWYDAVPANLNAHPPVERAKRMVAAMGGAEQAMAVAKSAMEDGDYRWSSDLLQQLVFANPANGAAKALLADSYEQQGYQSESAIWRNQFLVAAHELRNGAVERFATQSPDLIAAIPTQLLLDSAATRYDPEKMNGNTVTLAFEAIDSGEKLILEAGPNVLIGRVGQTSDQAAATLRGPSAMLLAMLFLKQPVERLKAAGLQVDGDAAAAQSVIDALDPLPDSFPIVTP